ncbi:MAG: GAF domain-containing protein [Gammaproteobacteria bacterium]|jgi:GAF domain-containing protein
MFDLAKHASGSKPDLYRALVDQACALLKGERDPMANAANLASLIFHTVPDLNWAGFYFLRDGELVVGPFQGKPACVRIALGRGVCGTAAERRETLVVEDVDHFDGHIPCDADSRSELVVPLIHGDALLGVLDLDSPMAGRFDADDAAGIEAVAAVYVGALSD